MKKLTIILSLVLLAPSAFADRPTPADCVADSKVPICHTPASDVTKATYNCVDPHSTNGNNANHLDGINNPSGSNMSHRNDWIITGDALLLSAKDACRPVPDDVCDRVGTCEEGTHHTANHTLDIYMGGFDDELYVCGVKLLGHECDLDDTNANGDFFIIDGVAKSEREIRFTKDNTPTSTQLHLNSFRFGAVYQVIYCYNYDRVVTSPRIRLAQQGHLHGTFGAIVTNNEYTDVAKVYANLEYTCKDDGGAVIDSDYVDIEHDELTLNTRQTMDIDTTINLGSNNKGLCTFTATFAEGEVGNIRPTNNGSIHYGQIKTGVDLYMDLIQN